MLHNLPAMFYSLGRQRYASSIIVVIDQDRDDCEKLKHDILEMAISNGLIRRGEPTSQTTLRVRIAMTELESWFLGDGQAIRTAYPRVREREIQVPGDVDHLPDAWEWLEHKLQRRRYFPSGLRKVEAAHEIAQHLDLSPDANASHSFRLFLRTLRETYGLD